MQQGTGQSIVLSGPRVSKTGERLNGQMKTSDDYNNSRFRILAKGDWIFSNSLALV